MASAEYRRRRRLAKHERKRVEAQKAEEARKAAIAEAAAEATRIARAAARAEEEAAAYAEQLERESAERNRWLTDELDQIESNPRQGRFQLSRILKDYLSLIQPDLPGMPVPDNFVPTTFS